jgi:hypothetical protein
VISRRCPVVTPGTSGLGALPLGVTAQGGPGWELASSTVGVGGSTTTTASHDENDSAASSAAAAVVSAASSTAAAAAAIGSVDPFDHASVTGSRRTTHPPHDEEESDDESLNPRNLSLDDTKVTKNRRERHFPHQVSDEPDRKITRSTPFRVRHGKNSFHESFFRL